MKLVLHNVVVFLLTILPLHASAAVLYVDLNCTNSTPPYTNWTTAARKIQVAIDAATNGDLVLVADGTYNSGSTNVNGANRVALLRAITVQSVNGPGSTTIVGLNATTPVRCAYVGDGATLSGFTLTGGKGADSSIIGNGGGAFCSGSAVLSNCIITGNTATRSGGGVVGGTLYKCTISGNTVSGYPPTYGYAYGGGVVGSTCYNCVLSGNQCASIGGGADESTLYNCVISGNSLVTTHNLLIIGGGAAVCTLINCTVVGNVNYNFASYGAGVADCTMSNCIVYYNSPDNSVGALAANSCCSTPLLDGIGNFTDDPALLNLADGDFHFQSNSPCINAGNNSCVSTATDLDGNPRIQGGTVDIGAYEFQNPSSVISYAWLQQYGLPTDGSADSIDSDGDGMNNWQEWIAGTDPTNPLSILHMLTPSNSLSGLTVNWQSVSGKTYFLQSSTNLAAQPAFSTIQSNIIGQAGTTTFVDSTATNSGPYFYRVGVQQ